MSQPKLSPERSKFASTKELIQHKERKAEKLREKRRSMYQSDSLLGFEAHYLQPSVALSPEKIVFDGKPAYQMPEIEAPKKTVSEAFFIHKKPSDLAKIKNQQESLRINQKDYFKGKMAAKSIIENKKFLMQFESVQREMSADKIIYSNEFTEKKQNNIYDVQPREVPLQRWKQVKFHSIHAKKDIYSERQLSNQTILNKNFDGGSTHFDSINLNEKSFKASTKDLMYSGMTQFPKKVKSNRSKLESTSTLHVADETIKNKFDESLKSVLFPSRPSQQTSVAETPIKDIKDFYFKNKSSSVNTALSHQSSKFQGQNTWQIQQMLANQILFVKNVVNEELEHELTERLTTEQQQRKPRHIRQSTQKLPSVPSVEINQSHLKVYKQIKKTLNRSPFTNQNIRIVTDKSVHQSVSPGYVYGLKSKQISPDSAFLSHISSPNHPRVVETVIGNYAREIDETNQKQLTCNKEMKALASVAATDIHSTYKQQLQQLREQQAQPNQTPEVQRLDTPIDNRERMLQAEMKKVCAYMKTIPFKRYKVHVVDEADIYPNFYTDAKGTAWANHWYNEQQKQANISEEARIKTLEAKKSRKTMIQQTFGRGFSVQSPRGKSSQSFIDTPGTPGRNRMQNSTSQLILDAVSPQRVKTAGKASAEIDENDIYEQFLPEEKVVAEPVKVEQEEQFDNAWDSKFDRFTESSMVKSHFMARLTFDPNFRKQHLQKQGLRKETRKASDISSNIFKTIDKELASIDVESQQEDVEKEEEEAQDTKYPKGLNKAYEELRQKKMFNKLVKHAGAAMKNLDDKEFDANRIYVNNTVSKLTNPVPLLSQIQNGQLMLSKQPIKRGVAQGFFDAVRMLKEPIKTLILDRCLIKDSVQAKIIQALSQQTELRCIKSVGNQFNRLTLQAMVELLRFDSVSKLQELSISHSNADQKSVFELLKCLLPKDVVVTHQELQDDQSKVDFDDYGDCDEDDNQKLRNKFMMKKEFSMPTSQIMLEEKQFVPKENLKSLGGGNVDKLSIIPIQHQAAQVETREAQTYLALKRKYFKRQLELNLVTKEEEAQLRDRQREIVEDLKKIMQKNKQEETSPQKSKKSKSSTKKSTKTSIKVLDSLKVVPKVQRLGLASVIQNKRVFSMLIKVLKANQSLVELDLSWNSLTADLIEELLDTISKFGTKLQSIDLSWINIGSVQLVPKQEDLFGRYLARSRSLLHLNLTRTNLEGNLLTKILQNIKRSPTLLAVHLCQAQLSTSQKEFVYKKMKAVDLIQSNSRMESLIQKFEADKPKYELMHTMWEYKSVVKETKKILEALQENHGSVYDCDCLILSRILGHPEIPNSTHWRVSNQCWVCQKWKYTLVFFDENSCQEFAIKDQAVTNQFRKAVFSFDEKFKATQDKIQYEVEPSEEVQPVVNKHKSSSDLQKQKLSEQLQSLKLKDHYISGTFTNWEPRKMHSLTQLVARLEGCDYNGMEFITYRNQLLQNFRTRLYKCLKYGQNENDIETINFPKIKNPLPKTEHLYVYADFIKPGVHKYQFLYNLENNLEFSVPNQFGVSPLRSHLTISQKEYKKADVARTFDKENSIFKEWRLTNQVKLLAGFVYELKFWRVPRFVKDETIQKKLFAIMCDNRELISTVFLMICSQSQYPSLSWLDFQSFLNSLNIIGVPGFQSADADRVYIAAKVPIKELRDTDLPEAFMSRHEFLEALVRVADQRYVLTKLMPSTDVALVHLLAVIRESFSTEDWMPWRKKRLWVLEVNDLFENNKISLQKIYKSFYKERKFFMNKQDALDLVLNIAPIGVADQEVLKCFGYSKMVITNDILDREPYDKIHFVELLEFLGRIAESKYPGTSPLVDKLEKVLEVIFGRFGYKLKSKHVEVEVVSVSEDEFDHVKYFEWEIKEFGQPIIKQEEPEESY